MRSFSLFLLAAASDLVSASPALVQRAPGVCNADNCLRSVRATQFPSRSLDCAPNLRTTVTPPAVTVTQISTVTESATLPPPVEIFSKRQETPTIPAYASFCSGWVRYSSACSCAGFSAVTETAPVPTVIITEFSTLTLSTTASTTPSTTPSTTASTTPSSTASTTASTTAATPAACVPTQAVQNGGFENAFQHWTHSTDNTNADITFVNSPAEAHTGSGVVHITSTIGGASMKLKQTLTVCPGTQYMLRSWTKYPGFTCRVSILFNDQFITLQDNLTRDPPAWIQAYTPYTPTTSQLEMEVYVQCQLEADIWLDDISLTPMVIPA